MMRIMLVIVALLISQISFAEPTHMGVEPTELISLILVCETQNGEESCGFKRTRMLSTTEPTVFKIPDGQILIVTEFDWKYVNSSDSDLKDQLIEVHLKREFLCTPGGIGGCPLPPVKSFGKAQDFGSVFIGGIFASGHVQMTTGFAISRPATLNVEVQDTLGKPLPFDGDSAELQVTVRGYLMPAPCGIPGEPPCR